MKLNEIPLDDFVVFQRGFDLPRYEFVEGEYPVIGSNSILGYHNKYKVNGPGIVTGRSGTLGKFQFIETNFWPHNTTLWVKDFKGNIPKFVYYTLLSTDFAKFNSGGAVPTLNKNLIKSYRVAMFSKEKQAKIAAILSAYDDLIEVNLQRIKLLEEAAELIYKEWFVNYRFPGHESIRFVDGIPEGWDRRTASRIAYYQNGFAFKPLDWKAIGIPIIKINELKNGISDETPRSDSPCIEEKYLIQDNDVLFSWSADLGVYWWTQGKAFLNQHIFNVKPIDQSHKYYVFFVLKDLIPVLKTKVVGTTMQHIRKSALDEVYCNFAGPEIIQKFSLLIKPLIDQQIILTKQNQILTKTRNLLLPKLMSGEIEV